MEYIVLATVIVIAILAIKSVVAANMTTLYTNAAAKTADAATSLGNLAVEMPK